MPPITVIIPTLGSAERAVFLDRAVESVLNQDACAKPLVVVNGSQVESRLLRQLQAQPEIETLRLADGNLPNALAAGRRAVETPFFSELDDDDLLRPGALASRLEVLNANSSIDAVISNTILRSATGDELSMKDVGRVQTKPLESLMRNNWMVPGSALFRSATITSSFFDDIPMYLEWTYLGMRLASERRLKFLAEAGCVHNVGLHFSLDESLVCGLSRPFAIRRLQGLKTPYTVRSSLRRKERVLWHAAAELRLGRGELKEAWKAHLRSMCSPFGWKYLSFSRHLLKPSFRSEQQSARTSNKTERASNEAIS